MSSVSQCGYIPVKATRREWLGLAVLSLPCLLFAMDLTVLHLAVPRISTDLRPTGSQLLWIVDIYGFVLAGLLITMGSLSDRIGCRRLLLVGAAAFGAASVLASIADSAAMLIVTRALLGVAGATLAPSTLSLIRHMFIDADQRSFAIAMWTMSFSIGTAIGPLLGGVILQYFGWGAVFLMAVPIMLCVLCLGPLLLPEFVNPNAAPMDLISATQSIAAVLLIIFGFKLLAAGGLGWSTAIATSGGLLLSVTFIRRQGRVKQPLIDLGLLREGKFAVLLLTYMLGSFVASGISLFTAQYLQLVLELSPLEAGLWNSSAVIGFVIGTLLTSVAARRVSKPHLMTAGLIVAALAAAMITQVEKGAGVGLLAGSLLVMSCGFAITFVPAIGLLLGSVPPERAGAVSAVSETAAEFGAALGIAIMGAVGMAFYRNAFSSNVPAGLSDEEVRQASETLGGALAIADRLPEQIGSAVRDAARTAFDSSLHLTAVLAVVIVLALAIAISQSKRSCATVML